MLGHLARSRIFRAHEFPGLKRLAVAPNPISFLGIRVLHPRSATVCSVRRLWMAAHAYLIVRFHDGLLEHFVAPRLTPPRSSALSQAAAPFLRAVRGGLSLSSLGLDHHPLNVGVAARRRNDVKCTASHRFLVFVPIGGTRRDQDSWSIATREYRDGRS